jgi:uncharacterized membrane protein YfcA
MMGAAEIAIVFLGALAGGVVNGLTGFGTAITTLGIWIHAIPPAAAASLAIICSVASQAQTLHLIWRNIRWKRAAAFVVPGLIGVPLGTLVLPQVNPTVFKFGLGVFLVIYPAYVLLRRRHIAWAFGGSAADGAVGFGGGFLGGLTGLSGVLPVVWTDIRGWSKDERRAVVQSFNMAVLSLALLTHAATGLLTRQVAIAAVAALPGTIGGAWLGAFMYRRLADRGYQRVVMLLLIASGIGLIWTSW